MRYIVNLYSTICSLFDASTKLNRKKTQLQADISLDSSSICSEDHMSTAETSFENVNHDVTNDGNISISTDTPQTPTLSSTPLKDSDVINESENNDITSSVSVGAVKTQQKS